MPSPVKARTRKPSSKTTPQAKTPQLTTNLNKDEKEKESKMSFIGTDWDLEGVEEDKPVPEGEYTLVVSDVKEKEDESGNPKGLLVILEIEGHDEAANVLHNISFPLPGDDASKLKNKRLFMKRFLTTFGIPFANGIDLTRFPGARAKVKLKQEEYNGTVSNTIHLPKLG